MKTRIVDIDGEYRDEPDFPVAVVRESENALVIDPILSDKVTRNLFGRIMTLVEATTDQYKLKAVKDLFAKELGEWETDVRSSARDIAAGGNASAGNTYTR